MNRQIVGPVNLLQTWLPAELMEGHHQSPERAYAWTLWEVDLADGVFLLVVTKRLHFQISIPISDELRSRGAIDVVVRAVDSAYNTQVCQVLQFVFVDGNKCSRSRRTSHLVGISEDYCAMHGIQFTSSSNIRIFGAEAKGPL